MATLGHTQEQPGLRGHSYSEDNLLKRFLVLEHRNPGRLAVKSFNTEDECYIWLLKQPDELEFLVKDQFDGDKIVYDEKLGGKK